MQEVPYIFPDGRMKPADAALYIGFDEGTLANWRTKGKGPRFIKKANRIFYLKNELDQWLAVDSCVTTAQARLTSGN